MAATLRRNAIGLLFAAFVVVLTTGLAAAWWATQGSGTASAATATLGAPTNVAGSPSGSDVTVTWTGTTGPGGAPVTGYYVVRYAGATPSAACGSSPVSLLPATPTSCTDSVADGAYTYRVTAVFHSWTAESDPSDEVTVSGDTTAPGVLSINRVDASPTNASSVSWLLTFSENVTGVDETDFVLSVSGVSGTSVTGVTGSGATRTVTASTGSGDGTLGLILSDDDSIVDSNGNPLGGAGTTGAEDGSFVGQAYTIDRADPTVTVEQAPGQSDPTAGATIHFTAEFSEPVTGLIGSEVTITGTASGGATAVVTGSGTTFDIEVTVTTSGTVVVSLPANVAQDAAGNDNEASTGADNQVTRDATAPTVTINQASGQADPTNASPIHFTVTFSEDVSGFTSTDVTLSGATSRVVTPVSASVYDVAVSGMTSSNVNVVASIEAGVAVDGLGNPNAASTTSDNVVTYDTVVPTVTSISRSGFSPTNDHPLGWVVTFSEPVNGVTTSSFSLATSNTSGAAPTVTSAIATGGSPSSTWMVSVATTGTVGANDGSVRLDLASTSGITDAATNALSATTPVTGAAYTFDTTVPVVTSVTRNTASPTNAFSVSWTVTFSESVTGFGTTDVALANTGLSSPSVTSVTGSGTTYTVTASTGSGSGTLGLNVINTNTVQDTATNVLTAGFTGEVYTIDKSNPTVVSANRAGTSPTNASSATWTVIFSESVTGVDTADFTAATSGGVTGASVTGVSGSGTTYTVTASTGSGSGSLGLNVNASGTGIVDLASNGLIGGITGQTYTIDKTAPSVVSINRGDTNPTAAASVSWTVIFSESVTGVDTADFAAAMSGGVTGASVTGVSGTGTTYTVTASTGSGSGTLGLNFVDNDSVVDGVGNTTTAGFTGQTYTVDKAVLTITSVARSGGSKKVAFSGTGGTPSSTVTVTICAANSFPCSAGNNKGTATATVAADGTWTTNQSGPNNLSDSTNYWAQAVQTSPSKTSTAFAFTVTSL